MSRVVLSLFVVFLLTDASRADHNWPRWRGPQQNGHSTETDLPTTWDENSVVWRTALDGHGNSSPIVFGQRVFLTSALDDGRQRMVMCLNRNSSELLWKQVVWTGTPEPTHRLNGWASASCVTDGRHVFAFFGHGGGLFCFTVDGELIWHRDLGRFAGPWGTAASPVLVGNMVIQNCDSDDNAYIVAFDKQTGEEIWKTKRDDARGWSTPILIEVNGREELVVNGDTGVRAYDPKSGREHWYCKSFNGRGSPTVTPAGNLLVTVNGKPGPIYAIRPGGSGDVTATHMAWNTRRGGGRDLSSPIVIDDYVLVSNMPGILSCYHGPTGKELWKSRLPVQEISASPISYNGLAFFLDRTGKTIVVRPGKRLEIVAQNSLDAPGDEEFRASITPVNGQLLIRSDRALYAIGRR